MNADWDGNSLHCAAYSEILDHIRSASGEEEMELPVVFVLDAPDYSIFQPPVWEAWDWQEGAPPASSIEVSMEMLNPPGSKTCADMAVEGWLPIIEDGQRRGWWRQHQVRQYLDTDVATEIRFSPVFADQARNWAVIRSGIEWYTLEGEPWIDYFPAPFCHLLDLNAPQGHQVVANGVCGSTVGWLK